MKKVIRVIDGIHINEYNYFGEAVTAAKEKIQSDKDKLYLINGKKVESYQFSGDFLFFSLDNGIYLTIFPNFNSIKWDISSVKPEIKDIKEEKIYFEFSDHTTVIWNWKKILDSFLNKKIAISPSDQFLFIFVQDIIDEYMVNFFVDKNDFGKKFLFISPS